jgi:hypothetical protein
MSPMTLQGHLLSSICFGNNRLVSFFYSFWFGFFGYSGPWIGAESGKNLGEIVGRLSSPLAPGPVMVSKLLCRSWLSAGKSCLHAGEKMLVFQEPKFFSAASQEHASLAVRFVCPCTTGGRVFHYLRPPISASASIRSMAAVR